jgi:hypothetical protein
MSARKRQQSLSKQAGIPSEDVNAIYAKISSELQQYVDQKDVGAAMRASHFLTNLSEEYKLPLDTVEKYQQEANALMNEWKRTLQESDVADFLSPVENKWFSVKVMELKGDRSEILVHYQGWGSNFDQWFTLDDELVILPPFSIISKQKKKEPVSQPAPTIEMPPAEYSTILVEGGEVPKDSAEDETMDGLRRGRRVRKVDDKSSNNNNNKSKISKKEKVEKDHNDWFCTNCGMLEAVNGSDLVLCDGLCRRSFHLECLSKAEHKQYVEQMATGDADSKYFCEHCRKSKHSCFLCGKQGIDFLDVLRCSQTYCGKYYHLKCLTEENATFLRPNMTKPAKKILEGEDVVTFIQNYGTLIDNFHEQQLSPSPENAATNGKSSTMNHALNPKHLSKKSGESFPISSIRILPDHSCIEITNYVSFRCPRHVCDTCYEFHGQVDSADLCQCHYCPRAFHSNCIPPASRYNSVCMVCPLHSDALLPGDASLLSGNGKGLATGYRSDKKGSDVTIDASGVSQQIVSFFEQLIIPDAYPDVQNILDNHYRLPLYLKNEVESIPPSFTMISRNNWDNFPPEKMPPLIIPDSGCDCRGSCGTSCFNFITRVECCSMKCRDKENPTLCHVGKASCGNRALQNRDYVKTKIFQEGSMGLGLKAEEDVPAGKLVIEYLGEIIDEDEMIRRMENQRILTPSDKEYYIMELYDGVYVDGKHQGSVSRYINHSCNPNCELQRWNVNGRIRIGIVAIRDIAKDEALSYDYQIDTQQADVFKCYCGSYNCRGTMAPKKDRRAQMEKLLQRGRILQTTSQSLESSSRQGKSEVTSVDANGSALRSETASVATGTAVVEGPGSCRGGGGNMLTLMSAAQGETAEERELRIQLVREAREKERNRTDAERRAEELTRSYVSKYLPGDTLTEMKQGPTKAFFPFARAHSLFLIRNLRPSRKEIADGSVRHLFLSRQERINRRAPADWHGSEHDNGPAKSSSSERNVKSASQRAESRSRKSSDAATHASGNEKGASSLGKISRKREQQPSPANAKRSRLSPEARSDVQEDAN